MASTNPPSQNKSWPLGSKRGLWCPQFKLYTGKSDPLLHIKYYSQAMVLSQHNAALMCYIFSASLGEWAHDWFQQLEPTSISYFDEFANEFISSFLQCLSERTCTDSLLGMVQGADESLSCYIPWFQKVTLKSWTWTSILPFVPSRKG